LWVTENSRKSMEEVASFARLQLVKIALDVTRCFDAVGWAAGRASGL